MEYVVNGVNPSKRQLRMTGYRCIGQCNAVVDKTPVEDRERLWSVAADWDEGGKVPEANENVMIKAGWNMIFDIEETPQLDMVEIKGRLTFKMGMNHIFKAKHLFINLGELIVGSDSNNPFDAKAEIRLRGE